MRRIINGDTHAGCVPMTTPRQIAANCFSSFVHVEVLEDVSPTTGKLDVDGGWGGGGWVYIGARTSGGDALDVNGWWTEWSGCYRKDGTKPHSILLKATLDDEKNPKSALFQFSISKIDVFVPSLTKIGDGEVARTMLVESRGCSCSSVKVAAWYCSGSVIIIKILLTACSEKF